MGLMSKVVSGTLVFALIGAGGYVLADINDLVPGFLTKAPEIADPTPFPTVTIPAVDPTLTPLGSELSGPLPQAEIIQSYIDKLVDNTDVLGESVAVVVSDSQTGETLGSHNATKAVVPASVQKLLTAVVALNQLDHERQLRTRVVQGGDGVLYLAGEGDMLLGAQEGDTTRVNGYAGLSDLADQVASKLKLDGTDTVRLFADGSMFTGDNHGPWEDDIAPMGWAAPVETFAVDNARKTEGEYAPRYLEPEIEAAKVFAERLKERGITVEGKIASRTYNSPGAAMGAKTGDILGEVKSAPIEDIVGYFLKTSDNTITEIIGHTVAIDRGLPASFQGATTAVMQGLETLGLNLAGVKLVDCSGLGEKSTVTAQLIDDVIDLLVSPEHPELTIGATSLPVGYLSGTLNDRYELRNGRGLVRAKTGSLIGVTALAGTVVTLDNRQLNFVAIADDTGEGGSWGPRKELDSFVEKLAECGCG